MINKTDIILLCAVLIIAACVQIEGRPSSLPGSARPASLQEDLQRGYSLLAEYEEYVDEDQDSAAHFRSKADLARNRNPVLPDDPGDEVSLPQKLKEEMETSRAWLGDAMQVFKTPENTRYLAEAQVNYDCWLERVLDGEAAEKWCRQRFYHALEGLKKPDNQRYSIYFDTASTLLNDAGKEAIRLAARNFVERDYWRVRLTGYTDNKGDKNSNLQLSIRRAVAVRNALAQNGVDFDKIVVDAMGEGSSVDDGAEDQGSSRRVDVAIVPVYLDQGQHGKNPGDVFPMSFGSGVDF